MRKIFVLIACFNFLLFFGCTKSSSSSLVHDEMVCKQLEGSWQQSLLVETEISLNPDNPAEVSGKVKSNSVTTLTFADNQTFSIDTKIEFLSYEPNDPTDKTPLPLEAMKDYFSQKISVKGMFIATESVIQYDHRLVTLNDSTEIPFEEFAASNPDAGTQIQTAAWRLEGDSLYFSVDGSNTQTELVYSRVK